MRVRSGVAAALGAAGLLIACPTLTVSGNAPSDPYRTQLCICCMLLCVCISYTDTYDHVPGLQLQLLLLPLAHRHSFADTFRHKFGDDTECTEREPVLNRPSVIALGDR